MVPSSDSSPRMEPSNSANATRGYRSFALAALTGALVVLCGLLSYPFLPAITWGVALAVVAWPLQAGIVRLIPREGLAAAVTTLFVVLAIMVPGTFVAYCLARESSTAAERVREQATEGTVRDKVAETPGMAGVVEWMDRVGIDVDREVHKIIETNTRDFSALASGSLMAALQFAIVVFILYHLLLDRQKLLGQLRNFLPMSRSESDRVVRSAADSIFANLHANVVTSVISGVGGGLMFWILGVPSPITWGSVIFVLSFLPMVGSWLIWLPAAAYLGAKGHWPEAGILLAWGIASMIVVDNLIYAWIAGERMRLHRVPALLAFLGGLALFGASGIVIGPAILAITVAVLDVWHRRASGVGNDPNTDATQMNGWAGANESAALARK